MAQEYAGWDWFALHLSDGRDVIVYLSGGRTAQWKRMPRARLWNATVPRRFICASPRLGPTVLSYWKSGKSAGRYPAAWRIKVPGAAINVTVNPLVAGQELITTASTTITYWEGAVAARAPSQGTQEAVEGYAELTGYAGTLGGIF